MPEFTNQKIEKILAKYSFDNLNYEEVKKTFEKLRDIDEICNFIRFSNFDGRGNHYFAVATEDIIDVKIHSWSHEISNDLFDPTDRHKAIIEISTKYLEENYVKSIGVEVAVFRNHFLKNEYPKYCFYDSSNKYKDVIEEAVEKTIEEWISKNIPLIDQLRPFKACIYGDYAYNGNIKNIKDEFERTINKFYEGYTVNNQEIPKLARRLNLYLKDVKESEILEKDLNEFEFALKYFIDKENVDVLQKILNIIKKE